MHKFDIHVVYLLNLKLHLNEKLLLETKMNLYNCLNEL